MRLAARRGRARRRGRERSRPTRQRDGAASTQDFLRQRTAYWRVCLAEWQRLAEPMGTIQNTTRYVLSRFQQAKPFGKESASSSGGSTYRGSACRWPPSRHSHRPTSRRLNCYLSEHPTRRSVCQHGPQGACCGSAQLADVEVVQSAPRPDWTRTEPRNAAQVAVSVRATTPPPGCPRQV
jgi:hypothetical protein